MKALSSTALLTVVACAFVGCAGYDSRSEMTPLEGSGEAPSVANRFPPERGGFAPSDADTSGSDPAPVERMR